MPSSELFAAEELQSPVIIQCTAGAAKWQMGFKVVRDVVADLVDYMNITVPVAMHLDHGTYEDCFKAIDAGFTSVMYDGSHEPTFEINCERTAEIVKLCSNGELADPAECKAIADLGVDFLACGIGNIHGLYPDDWAGLSMDRLAEIKALTGDLPLVLHGGTGIPTPMVQEAISNGIAKINVNTDLQVAMAKATWAFVESGEAKKGKNYDPRKLLKPGFDAIVARAKELIVDFGSDGKGWA